MITQITRELTIEALGANSIVRSIHDWQRLVTAVAGHHKVPLVDAEAFLLDNAKQDRGGTFGLHSEYDGQTLRQFLESKNNPNHDRTQQPIPQRHPPHLGNALHRPRRSRGSRWGWLLLAVVAVFLISQMRDL
jgi:hypothetical protein